MNVIIRPVTVDDIPQVWVIERESYPEPWLEQSFWDELENEFSRFYVADKDGLLIGFYDLWLYANVGHLLNIAIRRNYRHQGVGTVLLEHSVEEANKYNADLIYLEVRANNETAISMYKKNGFRKSSVKTDYYGDGENAVVMILNLKSER